MAYSKENYLKDLGSDGVNKTRVAVMRGGKKGADHWMFLRHVLLSLFMVNQWSFYHGKVFSLSLRHFSFLLMSFFLSLNTP